MLKNVQLTNGKPFVRGRYGKYLIPLAVRYNGDDPDLKPGEMPRYAIFFSLPYFDLKPLLKLKPVPKDTAIYPTRTLLQSHHRLASTEERDKKQAFRKLGQSKNEHVLYLPQLWCLVINNSAYKDSELPHFTVYKLTKTHLHRDHYYLRFDRHFRLVWEDYYYRKTSKRSENRPVPRERGIYTPLPHRTMPNLSCKLMMLQIFFEFEDPHDSWGLNLL